MWVYTFPLVPPARSVGDATPKSSILIKFATNLFVGVSFLPFLMSARRGALARFVANDCSVYRFTRKLEKLSPFFLLGRHVVEGNTCTRVFRNALKFQGFIFVSYVDAERNDNGARHEATNLT